MSTPSIRPKSSAATAGSSVAPTRHRKFGVDDDPIVHDAEPGAFLFGSWKNVVIAVWESQATASAVERLAKVVEIVAKTHPERSNIHFIANGAALPEADVRAKFVALMKQNAAHLAHVVVVYGGSGFWASAFRSFVTGMRWVAPKSVDVQLVATIEEAARKLPPVHFERTRVELDPRRLLKVLEEWTTFRADTK